MGIEANRFACPEASVRGSLPNSTQIPANRIGYGPFAGYQLKIIQEAITLVVFAIFAYFYLGEPMRWNYAASFACLFGAVAFAFWGRF